jgi:hypothetical protein
VSEPVITRKGKIARLPSALREQVNQRLDDGQPGSVILPWLNGLKDVQEVLAAHFDGAAVNEQNLSDWRQGGFQDWLGRQDERKNIQRLTNYALNLVSDGKDPHDAANIIAAGRLLATIEEELTPSLIAQILAEKPGDMIGLIGSLVALQKERRQGVETRLSVEKFQRETAELFQKWYADARAKEIIESKATTSIKTEKLVQLIFGERPAAAAPAS